ncbi:hypothetical protein SG26_16375 [Haloarcula sp. CBA1115]|uniref:hypothetical protein n=1 Tax=unclassified Haloarcula TaxID=2624677 RepID=UPI000595516F|nr:MULTISPECIES: hypothetical protein [unclassified Haloarcula]AJF27196.1 hypothetical protein SG26_16375 [Haloarcula sp. CBA1115]
MARIQVRVSDEQKELWDEYAENSPEYRTTADLVRTAVTREINGGWQTGGGMDDETARKIESMDNTIDELMDQMAVMTKAFAGSPIMADDASEGLSDFDVSQLPEDPDEAYYPDKATVRRKLREVSDNIKNIRETDDGGFYQGSSQ